MLSTDKKINSTKKKILFNEAKSSITNNQKRKDFQKAKYNSNKNNSQYTLNSIEVETVGQFSIKYKYYLNENSTQSDTQHLKVVKKCPKKAESIRVNKQLSPLLEGHAAEEYDEQEESSQSDPNQNISGHHANFDKESEKQSLAPASE